MQVQHCSTNVVKVWNSKFSDDIFKVIPCDPRFTLFYLDLYCGIDDADRQLFGTSKLKRNELIEHKLLTATITNISNYDKYVGGTRFINQLITLYEKEDDIQKHLINDSSKLLNEIFGANDADINEIFKTFFVVDFTDSTTVKENKNVNKLGRIYPPSNIGDFNKKIIERMRNIIKKKDKKKKPIEAIYEIYEGLSDLFNGNGGSSNSFFNTLTRKNKGGRKMSRRNKTMKDRCPQGSN